ncbi:FAD-dependent oxidoreductase [Lactococcus nasutitermitis]|uniref:NADH:ubiquinone reductase (non-electrogenic) n=1 Tax=Lactococcus nasutitermitis TaxID=1652957 RepID=A0ABV9JFJ7_9LACT|nr:NAD(P)/FAD-dependent oxidoreductase [Lactococcus nasutitermitis]
MAKKKIVVIGAGFAGLSATRKLSSKLKNDVEITLIDKHSYQTMMTQLHEVAAGRVPFTNAQYDLQRLLGKRKNISIVTDKVVNLDKENKTVVTENGSYDYDYVIVAIGGEPNDFGVPGVKDYGFTLWSLEDAMKIKRQLEIMVQLASTERDEAKRKALLTINVAGSGFTGIEMVGELIDWRKKVATDWKLNPEEITLNVVEMMPTILNTLDRKQADKALAYLKKKNVNVLLNHGITAVEEGHIVVNVGGHDEEKVQKEIPSYTLIWTTGVQGNTQAQPYELTETERGHRLLANDYMEAIGFEGKGIYVAGDVSGNMDPKSGRPQPQIVEAAEQTGHTAADNIIADIKGGEKHKFVGKYQGTMVSVGSHWGVAMVGSLRLTGFFAMAMKNFIYVLYTLQIYSAYYLFTYLKNEIFHTEDNRNLMRGHTSRRGNVLWALPLRLFYGVIWLLDALPKVFGGANIGGIFGKSSQSWMGGQLKITTFLISNPKNSGWLKDFYSVAHPAAGASTHEVVTKATGHFAFNAFNGLSYDYGTTPNPITNGVPHWMQAMMKIFMPNTQTGFDIALFLQKTMSIVELLLALAILSGTFTWIASAATAGLTLMFATTGMLTWVGLWYIPVAIALMAGAGRAFGLDRWIQPWLQKILGKLWYGKPRSIYKGR